MSPILSAYLTLMGLLVTALIVVVAVFFISLATLNALDRRRRARLAVVRREDEQ